MQHVKSAYKCGLPVCYGANGHAVVRIGDGLDINSWDRSWGQNGLGTWVSEATLARELPRYGAFVPYIVADPDDDGDLPQPK